MGRSPTRRSSSVATTSSRCPGSTRRSTGRRAAPRRQTAVWRFAPTSRCERGVGGIDAHRAAELAARGSYGRLLAYLAASWRDVAAAEDALGDALVSALEAWPRVGVPANPDAWLLAAARRRLIDVSRHAKVETAVAPTLELL